LSDRAPSAEDDVVFDSVSNATDYTVTISNSTTVCRDVTIAGPATGNLTLAGSGFWYVYGSLTLPATGFTRSFTSRILFYGTGSHTITTNGVTLASVIHFEGTGTYTLQDALNDSALSILINAGVFNTDGKNLTCGSITATSGATAGTLTLGASTVSATTIIPNAPLTINAGTSNITLSLASAGIGAGVGYTGNTFNNVTFSSTAITTANFYGNNTFNNLTFTAPSVARISNIVLFGNQTVTGTLTVAGQLSVRRYFIRSGIIGTTRTLTVGTVASLVDVDFRDITIAGASSPWSGTQLGDCGGNTNITFPSPKTVYWNLVGGGSWASNAWATSSGGTVDAANFPLAQDTAIFDDTGLNTGSSITFGLSGMNVGNITSTKTNAYTLGYTGNVYGSITLTSSMTTTSMNPTFAGRSAQTLTQAGATFQNLFVSNFGSTVTLQDNLSFGNSTFNSGTFDFNGNNVSCNSLAIATSLSKTLNLGTGTITIAQGIFNSGVVSNITVNASTSSILVTGTSSINFGIPSNSLTWNNVTFSSAFSGFTLEGTNTFNNLTFTAPTATTVSTLSLGGDLNVSGTLALGGGTSATQRMGVVSNIPGTQRTITAATVTGLTDIDFRDIAAAGASAPWSGTRLGNCQGNSGITFASGTNKYWNLAGTQNWSATGWATSSGGTPAANDFPLAQDTCIFDDTGSADTVTLNAPWNIGTINMSSRTSAMTFAGSVGISIYGDVTYGSGITSTASGNWLFRNTSTQTFTTAGRSLANAFTVNNPLCVFNHGDAYTSTMAFNVLFGSYNTQNYNISVNGITSNNSNTRTINLGTSTITCASTVPVVFTDSTGLTFSGASSTINLSSTSSKTFNGGGQTFGIVSSTGGTTNPLTIQGSNTFGTLTNSAYTNLIFGAGTTQNITNFTYSGASGSVVRWYTNIPGQRATFKGNSAAVGTNSVDGGNNSGLAFTGTSPDYFYVKDIAYSPNVILGNSNFFMFF
jgi:hypothetical protein